MKNKFLLLGATALMSTMALNVNAGGTLTLNAEVGFISEATIEEVRNISFGRIMTPHAGETVNISPNGTVSGTARVISTENGDEWHTIPTRPGQIKITKGSFIDADIIGISYSGPVELKTPYNNSSQSESGDVVCGTVDFTSDLVYDHADNDYNYYNYGGTFTVDSNISESLALLTSPDYIEGHKCTGSGTATLILRPDWAEG